MSPDALSGSTYSSYPGASLDMHIYELWTIGEVTLPNLVDELNTSLTRIATALGALEVSWAGDAKDAAQKVNEQWDAVAESLFGTKSHPELGILNRIAVGIRSSVANYDQVEDLLSQQWKKYVNDINSFGGDGESGGGGDGQQSPLITEV